MQHAKAYLDGVHALLNRLWETQQEAMNAAIEAMVRCAADGGVIHIFGCGHTQVLGLEVWYRAGQPAFMSPVFNENLWPYNGPLLGSAVEKLEGFGTLIFDAHDARPGEVILVLSNSGRNAVPIDVALKAKERGLTVVAVSSMDYSTRVSSKHSSGKRLFEIADITIDNCGPLGDASLAVPGVGPKVGPVTTILNAALVDAMLVEVVARLAERGVEPPVFTSANLDTDLSKNAEYVRRYAPRVRYYKD
ncbi:SIS domain-containing protein [Symbiobacterium thermophilum]|uniref:SIS domain-containing protein n=1 Tax=Symbiobacterium thermophilum TaxID=2734 RepID=A0A953I4H4_SYMTR|nr:SIS domain-containing protein [Symbiobacterium thermophilum]MBY6277440.1 hypothetical protein [Symbiobacterium thermophilum]